jgi:hypothetical protein
VRARGSGCVWEIQRLSLHVERGGATESESESESRANNPNPPSLLTLPFGTLAPDLDSTTQVVSTPDPNIQFFLRLLLCAERLTVHRGVECSRY